MHFLLANAPVATSVLYLVFFIIFLALVFDFLNGFHDAANSIATIVSTRVLTPRQAVAWAAFFNFVAAFVFGTAVSATISKGIVDPKMVDIYVVFGGLVGAIVWNIVTWLLALPTSSSHALVSGLAGAAIAKAGIHVLIWPGKWAGIILFIFLGPIIGFLVGGLFMVAVAWIFRRSTPNKVDVWFRRMQLVSAAIFSLSHGGNDAQKTMGIIVMLLAAAGCASWTEPASGAHWFDYLNLFGHSHTVAPWVILTCTGAIGLGTMFGGWRIVKTMGSGITRLAPVGGFCAETAAATTIIFATNLGVPISTTHAITGSILGVGTTKGVRSVRWIWGQRIVIAWVLTIPCSAFVGACTYFIVHKTIEPFIPAPTLKDSTRQPATAPVVAPAPVVNPAPATHPASAPATAPSTRPATGPAAPLTRARPVPALFLTEFHAPSARHRLSDLAAKHSPSPLLRDQFETPVAWHRLG